MATPPSSPEPDDNESSSLAASHPGVNSSGSSRIALSDPAFKLFGRTIIVASIPPASPLVLLSCRGGAEGQNGGKAESDGDRLSPSGVDEAGICSGCGSGSEEEEDVHVNSGEKVKDELNRDEDDFDVPLHSEGKPSAANLQDTALAKPDKPVPCPRCDSMDTKFCYFNNYNVNQPRHFCRNCQRYWTAGGTLRNVPVGAGRRKNKHSSQHRQSHGVTVVLRRDNAAGAQPLLSCSFHRGELKTSNNPVQSTSALCIPSVRDGYLNTAAPSSCSFSFSRNEVPISAEKLSGCSMLGATAMAPQPFLVQNSNSNSDLDSDVYGSPPKIPKTNLTGSSDISNITEASIEPMTERKDVSTSSTATASASDTGSEANFEGGANLAIPSTAADSEGSCDGASFPVFGLPWPHMGMNWAGVRASASSSTPSGGPLWAQGSDTAATAFPSVPAWCGPPAALSPWPPLSGAMWNHQGWSVPWTLPWNAATVTAAAAAAAGAAANGFGKRPRAPSNGSGDGSLCIPKTLRIHDPEEAACTSILTTLGVNTKSAPLISGGIFNAFKPKAEVFQPKKVESSNPPQDDKNSNPAAAM